MNTRNIIIGALVIIIVGVGIYLLVKKSPTTVDTVVETNETENNNQTGNINRPTGSTQPAGSKPATTTTSGTAQVESKTVIGKSVEGHDIVAYQYGTGATEILLVGGIHGGYSWNTPLVAYEMMDYLKANPNIIPSNVKVTVVPVLNPDGLIKVVGTTGRFSKADVSTSDIVVRAGRFNAREVDLNRNFDCDWQSRATWQNTPVSGGGSAFSEPEALAMKSYVEMNRPDAVIVWYSAAGGVFSSSCGDGISAETGALTNIYAKASSYPEYASFDYYETTGDMTNWLAKIKVPAISVLLTTHDDTEREMNRKGLEAVLKYYAR